MNIRKAKSNELNTILDIYKAAKCFMEAHGNIHQWSGPDAITMDKVRSYYDDGILYVCTSDNVIHCAFTYKQGEDPTYGLIDDGKWLNNECYGTIHRLASAGTAKGIVKSAAVWALEQNRNVRIDTHHDNYVMQNALTSAGFKRCGIIYLANGEPRIAYQLVGDN